MFLRCKYIHLMQDNRDAKYLQVNHENGVAVKITSKEYHLRENSQLSTGAFTGRARLTVRNIKNAVYKTNLVFRYFIVNIFCMYRPCGMLYQA